ncbi:MAG: hypothetical protein V3V20_08415 [Algisphaera sp.]
MFRAIGKYFRALGYLVTGRIDKARKTLSTNPHVVQATYDRVVREKKDRLQQYKDAVAKMIAQQEKKSHKLKQLTEDVNQLSKLKEGAAAKARQLVKGLQAQGQSMEQIKQNAEYVKCMRAFNDFTNTEKEKSAHIVDLETDVGEIGSSIESHKIQLQSLLREIDKIKQESSQAVADMITAKEEEEIADMISGISKDRTNEELQELRDLRQETKARARVARELAGTDTATQEAEFLEYARTSDSSDEFDKLIGLAAEIDSAAPEMTQDAPVSAPKLPEG